MGEYVNLRVLGITYSQIQSGAYALVLAENNGNRRIPIIIGTSEAQSIAIELEHLKPPRPLTHDLFISFAQAFEIQLKRVFIYKYEDGVFSSELLFQGPTGEEKKVDSRTSDAISLALRTQAEILTTEDIIRQAGITFEEQGVGAQGHVAEPVSSGASQEVDRSGDLTQLRLQLQVAIGNEKYEEASRLRDEIQKIENIQLHNISSETDDSEETLKEDSEK